MKAVDSFPTGKNFVAIWIVNFEGKDTLFTVSLHYKNDQYFAYDNNDDYFVPQCDHGYSEAFFESVNAAFFVAEE